MCYRRMPSMAAYERCEQYPGTTFDRTRSAHIALLDQTVFPMSNSLEQRLTELEVRIAVLDQTVQTLDATVAAQDRALGELKREFARLREELGSVQVSLRDDVRD